MNHHLAYYIDGMMTANIYLFTCNHENQSLCVIFHGGILLYVQINQSSLNPYQNKGKIEYKYTFDT